MAVRMREDPVSDGTVSRRSLFARGALAGVAALLAGLPGLLDRRGLLGTALAQSGDQTTETLNGLLAFLAPGSDEYSTHQGQSTSRPGGVGSGNVVPFISDLDRFVPASTFGSQGVTVPSSSGVAALLNDFATAVDPSAAVGPFTSPFANLSFANKAEVFKQLEAQLEPGGNELSFVAGILPGFATFLTFSEAAALDPASRKLNARPVGWELTDYAGPSDGWPELRGYYHSRRRVKGAGPNATRRPH